MRLWLVQSRDRGLVNLEVDLMCRIEEIEEGGGCLDGTNDQD
jgi:hypothetical protein